MAKFSRPFEISVGDEKIELMFKSPNHKELTDIDLQYRKMYSVAIEGGVPAEYKLSKLYKQDNTWTDEDDEVIDRLSLKVAILNDLVDNPKTEKDKENIVDNVNTLSESRKQLNSLITRRTELFRSSAEGMAEEQKIHKLIELCCIKKDSEDRMFDNYDSYVQFLEEYPESASIILREAYFFVYNLPEDVAKDWAEVKYSRKILEEESKKQSLEETEEIESS